MCLNNTKELELCNSRRRKKMPDPLHSHLEFTRNRNSCTGPEQSLLACYLSDAQRKDKRNLVCVFVCVYVCVPRCTLMYVRLSSELHGTQRQQSQGAGKKNPISYQENFFTSVRGQNSAGQGSEQSGGAVFPGIKHDHLQRGFPA